MVALIIGKSKPEENKDDVISRMMLILQISEAVEIVFLCMYDIFLAKLYTRYHNYELRTWALFLAEFVEYLIYSRF